MNGRYHCYSNQHLPPADVTYGKELSPPRRQDRGQGESNDMSGDIQEGKLLSSDEYGLSPKKLEQLLKDSQSWILYC